MKTILHYFPSPTKSQNSQETNENHTINTSKSTRNNSPEKHKNKIKKKSKDVETNDTSDEIDKTNAFQLMMDGRNKVIGRNLSGSDLNDKSDDEPNENKKEVLKIRKDMLNKWNEDKGASKRKREENEREIYVNEQMEKRARKLKKLLKFKTDDESSEKDNKRRSSLSLKKTDDNCTKNCDSTWKMKIKLKINESPEENKRNLRPRKARNENTNALVLDEEEPTTSKPRKIAPIFALSSPKPKIDPVVAEARKQFLLSGLPSNLKKNIEREQILEEKMYDVFPQISHIQQLTPEDIIPQCNKSLNLNQMSPLRLNNQEMRTILSESCRLEENCDKAVEKPVKITKFTEIVNEIKQQHPDYPVYKTFKQIFAKKKKKRRNDEKLWTVKYKPMLSGEFLSNQTNVKFIKQWLNKFNEQKRKRRYTSESEFELSSSDSDNFPEKSCSNTILLVGPSGCGKTCTVYGLCNELGYNVVEVNASSRRTGKKLMQTIQEATQSHQMLKNDKKMNVLLVEDIDIVFEQDDGFITALLQLIQTTKRPIILTTNDLEAPFVQKFINFRQIHFKRSSSCFLAIYMQLICLVEGLYVDYDAICSLLDYFKGDTRRTLLHLQFWILSGGDLSFNLIPLRSSNIENENLAAGDEDLSINDNKFCKSDHFIHKNCFKSVLINSNLISDIIWSNLNYLLENERNLNKIGTVSQLYDKILLINNLNKCKTKFILVKDGIETNENMENYNSSTILFQEYSEFILNRGLDGFKLNFNDGLDVVVRKKPNLQCLKCVNNNLNRKSLYLDYFSTIRCINRVEEDRFQKNTKRGNRFRHYLNDFDGFKTKLHGSLCLSSTFT